MKYLGFVLSECGYKPDPSKVHAIVSAPAPLNAQQVKSFLGMASFYHNFIPNFASVACHLYDLTKSKIKFSWTNEAQQAFDSLKSNIKDAVFLSKFDPDATMIVEVDASPIGVGGVLYGKNSTGEISTLCFASKKLSPAEQNYAHIDREALAIIFAINRFSNFWIQIYRRQLAHD